MIEIDHLGKDFDGVQVVKDLSLKLIAGEVLGFLGPNGAGKSTTMKMLTGFLEPSQGSAKIFGHDIQSDTIAAQKLIGYLPEGAPSYDEMTPASFLNFIAEVRGFSGDEKKLRIADVVSKMSLEGVLHQKIETLSKGFKRRVGLAQAIIHDPKVLFLDEPTDGLDPNQKHQVRELIRGLSKDKIVIISTHILEEVSAVCNRVIIISEGRLVVDCSPEALEKQSSYYGAVSLEFDPLDNREEIKAGLAVLPGVGRIEITPNGLLVFPLEGAALYPALSQYFQYDSQSQSQPKPKPSNNIYPRAMFLERGRLDEVFHQLTLGGEV